jgi:copper chaperone NosL
MKPLVERSTHFLSAPLGLGPRGLVLIAALLLVPTYLTPLWKLTMFAPQYPDGLRLSIYSYKLEGGNRGQDVREINVLNHYIGMRDLSASDFSEFKWIPFVVGALGLVFLRCALIGNISSLVDIFVLYVYFGLFSLWSFGYKLYNYGHSLAPTAAVKVAPFMPPLFGHRKLANFDVYSYPAAGSYALAAAALVLAAAMILAGVEERVEERAEEAVVAG